LKARGLVIHPIPTLSECGAPLAALKDVGRARLPAVETKLALVANACRAHLPLMEALLAHAANPGRRQLPLAETALAGEPVLPLLPVPTRGVPLPLL
jgi:hypothetical protein